MFNFIPGSGNPKKAKIILVGEQPARTEAKTGKCFTGPAGKNLDECLNSAGIFRSDCYITNIIKTPEGNIEEFISVKGKGEIKSKANGYLEFLKMELSECQANVIVPLGNTALFVLANRIGINNWRGSVIESTLIEGRKLLPTIHPATFTGEKLFLTPNAYLNKHLITLDLIKANKESEFPEIKTTKREILIRPTFREAEEYIDNCIEWVKSGKILMYDIELTPFSQELSCISFAMGPRLAMCIPFISERGNYFSLSEESYLMSRIAEIMENPLYLKGGQNVIFDSHYLLRKYGIRTFNLHDTMVAQRILYPEYRVGLNFITSLWTDLPYYKEDGKIWLEGNGTYEKGWNYNCLDSLSCAESFTKQLEELEEKGNIEAYKRQTRLIEPLTFMMEHGIKIDLDGVEKEFHQTDEQIKALEAGLNEICGINLNARSSKQLQEYFYTKKGVRPRLVKGKPTMNEDTMVLLSVQGFKEAKLINKIRKLTTLKSTFLNPEKVDPDGRMRCSYNPVGTKFARISSSKNIFNRGTNLQNVPHHVLSYFLADEGCVVYSLDMSQIEARIVAYVGNITSMIEVFEKGLDIHRMTAALIFKKYYEEISDEKGSTLIGGGEYSERDVGKISNHAFNYGFGPESFSIDNELPLEEGKWIHSSYHAAYPGVRNGYWEYVKTQLKEKRTLTNLYGRKTTFLNKWSDSFLNVAYSCIPQGTCGDHVNEKGINFVYYNETEEFKSVELLTQIHDSIEIQIPLCVPLDIHSSILLEIKRSLETPLEFKGKKFIVPADLTVKKNLNKRNGIEIKGKKFSTNPSELEEILKESLVKLNLKGN